MLEHRKEGQYHGVEASSKLLSLMLEFDVDLHYSN
jgi:hypothetical protein